MNGLFSFVDDFENYFGTNTSCVIVSTEFTFMDAYCDKFFYELIAELRYCFKLLVGYSSVSLSVINGDIRAVSLIFDTRPQQSSILWTKWIFQVPKQSKPDNKLDLPA